MEEKTKTLEMVNAGLHCSFNMSRQMLPLLLILGWKTFVLNATCAIHTSETQGITAINFKHSVRDHDLYYITTVPHNS